MDYTRDQENFLPQGAGRFLHDVARDLIVAQSNQWVQLDAKIQSILGFAAAFVGITLATLALRTDDTPDKSWAFLALGGVYFLSIVALGAWAYLVRDFEHGPKLKDVWREAHAGTMDEEKLYCWAAESYTESYEENKRRLKPKIIAAKLMPWVIGFEFAALSIAVLASL